jgi:Fur family transcriptional regulator, ferric uptake regulator
MPTRPGPPTGATRVDAALAEIREHGGRITAARRAVLAAILDAGEHHFTAAEVFAAVERTSPRPDRATVYRTLELLTEIGLLKPLQLDGDATVYHRTDHDHGHLVCERCGRITEIRAASLSNLAGTLTRETGFVIDVHGVAMSGTCGRCSEAAPATRAGHRAHA